MAIKFYWDACVCIDWIQATNPARVAILRPIIDAATGGDVLIVASALVLAEVVRANGDVPMSDAEDASIRTFFLHPYIEVRPIDQGIAHLARTIMRKRLEDKAANPHAFKKIPLHDAIHIACALECGCDCLHSFDGDDMLPEHQKHGIAGHPLLKVEWPSYTPPPPPSQHAGQQTLFGSNLGLGLDGPTPPETPPAAP